MEQKPHNWSGSDEVCLEGQAGAGLLQVITRSLNLILTKYNGQPLECVEQGSDMI